MSDKGRIVWTFPEPLNSKNKTHVKALVPDKPNLYEQRKPTHTNDPTEQVVKDSNLLLPKVQSTSDMPVSSPDSSASSKSTYGVVAKTDIPHPYELTKMAVNRINNGQRKKLKCLWLETSGCFGEVISLLNGDDPDILFWLKQMVDVTFFGSIMAEQGEDAYQQIVDTVNSGEEYILAVDGAIPLAEGGHCAIMATYKGKLITAAEAVKFASTNAKEILCVGTCASYGGPTAARPNETKAIDVGTFLNRPVLRAPGCPCNPIWCLGIFAYLVNFGHPPTDEEGRPLEFYGKTIHAHCPRRSFFDKQIFATKFGDPECMIALGCRGPVTNTLCPFTRWNNSNNWPIGDNTTCIGCANKGFPDLMEPFVKYSD